jgi:lipopolysaccharide/colanic/teichoic acid biosynthesis glycosyltransferase
VELEYTQTWPSTTLKSRRQYQTVKRVLDVTLSLVASVFLLPIMAAIALLIKLDSPGPVLFIQARAGRGGRPFRMFKFRTMWHNVDRSYHEAFLRAFVKGEIEHNGTEREIFKPFVESQVTRVGRILRKTSLDELPQLLNILRGEMSLVGPRPNVMWEVEEYESWHRERLVVLPGITGWAQVNGRSSIDFDSIVQYDIEYVRNQSLWLDLRVLWQTAWSILSGRGAH